MQLRQQTVRVPENNLHRCIASRYIQNVPFSCRGIEEKPTNLITKKCVLGPFNTFFQVIAMARHAQLTLRTASQELQGQTEHSTLSLGMYVRKSRSPFPWVPSATRVTVAAAPGEQEARKPTTRHLPVHHSRTNLRITLTPRGETANIRETLTPRATLLARSRLQLGHVVRSFTTSRMQKYASAPSRVPRTTGSNSISY